MLSFKCDCVFVCVKSIALLKICPHETPKRINNIFLVEREKRDKKWLVKHSGDRLIMEKKVKERMTVVNTIHPLWHPLIDTVIKGGGGGGVLAS